ncbi:hypothetical protein HDU76_001637 [Blyttiomyces sp. JEL0837]|nr:hypothetical protein HDU76_001637 [Blyttiomyces sp. JEL0837]
MTRSENAGFHGDDNDLGTLPVTENDTYDQRQRILSSQPLTASPVSTATNGGGSLSDSVEINDRNANGERWWSWRQQGEDNEDDDDYVDNHDDDNVHSSSETLESSDCSDSGPEFEMVELGDDVSGDDDWREDVKVMEEKVDHSMWLHKTRTRRMPCNPGRLFVSPCAISKNEMESLPSPTAWLHAFSSSTAPESCLKLPARDKTKSAADRQVTERVNSTGDNGCQDDGKAVIEHNQILNVPTRVTLQHGTLTVRAPHPSSDRGLVVSRHQRTASLPEFSGISQVNLKILESIKGVGISGEATYKRFATLPIKENAVCVRNASGLAEIILLRGQMKERERERNDGKERRTASAPAPTIQRITTVTRKGRFLITREPSAHYYSHVRRLSVGSEVEMQDEGGGVVLEETSTAGTTGGIVSEELVKCAEDGDDVES